MLISCLLSGCPRNPPNPDPVPDDPGISDPVIPLKDSPGLRLLYTVNDPRGAVFNADQTARILIADPETGRREVLFEYPGFVFHLVPSPLGTDVAFVGNVRIGNDVEERHLFLYDISAGSSFDVSASGQYTRSVKSAPIFTPDGASVLFVSRRAADSPVYNIFKCNVTTGQPGGLYTEPVEDTPLAITPDGTHCIAVGRDTNTPGRFFYITIDIASGTSGILHQFENVTKVGPAGFSPDGRTIFCDIKPIDAGSTLFGGAPSREVIAIDLESGNVIELFDPGTVSYVYQVFPDENENLKLLIRRQEVIEGEETPMSMIGVSNADGSNFTYLTDTSARSYLLPPPSNIPPIAPDLSLIYFFRQDPLFDHEDIWVMGTDGTDAVNISNTAGYNEGSAGWIVIPGEQYNTEIDFNLH